jgi:predicted secreted protein
MYALVNDQDIPVDSLKSVVAGLRGEILITGVAKTDTDSIQVRKVFSSLHKKDVVSFNVVTTDWKTITGKGAVTDLVIPSAPEKELPFYIKLKRQK